jgi:hypothetical protein
VGHGCFPFVEGWKTKIKIERSDNEERFRKTRRARPDILVQYMPFGSTCGFFPVGKPVEIWDRRGAQIFRPFPSVGASQDYERRSENDNLDSHLTCIEKGLAAAGAC